MTDAQWERKLGIQTAAAAFEKDDNHHSRYEPTSYAVLQRLAGSGYIQKNSVLVDYGCGKGRVGFFLNYITGCRTIGVEYDEKLFEEAEENHRNYTGGNRADCSVHFTCVPAERYHVQDADSFYFFNPFSVNILRCVLERIFESYYENPREMKLYFYYALDEYRSFLMTDDRLRLMDEIECGDLFHNSDPKEKILVYAIE